MVLKVFNKKIPDESGSAMQFRIQAREALWGIVDAIESLAKLDKESKQQLALDEINDATLLEMQEFDVDGQLPFEFGSKKKRRNHRKEKQVKKMKSGSQLHIPPYDGSLIEHNIYRMASKNVLCRVIGNAPSSSGSNCVVQVLCSEERAMVDRCKDLLPLNSIEQHSAAVEANKDVEFRYASRCPSGVHLKYWDQRYRLFSKYDEGIILDDESWYSVTPERIARHITQRCVQQSIISGVAVDTVMDCFSGCGGNTIPFAYCKRVKRVLAVDIDQVKLDALKHNANIYKAGEKIDVVCKDVYALLEGYLNQRKGGMEENFPAEGLVEHLKGKLCRHYQLHGRNSIVIKLQPRVSTSLGSGGHIHFRDHEDEDEDEVDTPLEEEEEQGGASKAAAEKTKTGKEAKITSDEECTAAPSTADADEKDEFSYPVPDLIVMSPPWGGPEYCSKNIVFDLPTMLPCGDGFHLLLLACAVAKNVVYLLPKNVADEQLEELKKLVGRPMMVENIYLNSSFKVKVVYVGNIFKKLA